MRNDGSTYSAEYLTNYIMSSLSPSQTSLEGVHEGNDGIEVRTRDPAKREDQSHESGAGSNRIRQKRQDDIAVGQSISHDAGADHCCHKECSAKEFGNDAARK
jgi:hypothetical protein